MSIEKNIEKVVDQNVEQITIDFKSFIPDNIVEIAIGYSISFVFALLIFFIGKWISKSVVKILGKALRKVGGVDETLVKFLENIVYYALLTVVIIAALNKLGIATTSFFAILGAAGLAVGLALKDSLGNFASGVMIVLFKPFKAGDSVVAGGVSGTVTEVTIFYIVFLTADNQEIIVTNSYIKNAKDVLTNIINSNPKVLKDNGFGISVTDLAETSVQLGVNVWAKSSDYGSLKAELLEEIKIKFDEVGITIPYSKNVYQQIKN